jgi:hypothetical protein
MKRKLSLALLLLATLFLGAQGLKAQQGYTARVYYLDGPSVVVDNLEFEALTEFRLYEGDINENRERNVSFSDIKSIEFLWAERYVDESGFDAWDATARVTFKNGRSEVYGLYEYSTASYTGTTGSGDWTVLFDKVGRIEFQ